MRSLQIGAAVVLLLGPLASSAKAAIPRAADPKAVTERQVRAAEMDFRRRIGVELYKTSGKHDPKWDEKAIAFLEAAAISGGYSKVNHIYWPKERRSFAQLCEMGKEVLGLGCDDPLVVSRYGIVLYNFGKKNQSLEHLRKSIPDLLSSKYPPFWAIIGMKRMLENPTLAGNSGTYLKLFPQKIAESFATPGITGMDQRFVLEMAWDAVETDPALTTDSTRTNFRQSVLDAAAKIPNADPWVVNMYSGRFYTELAWEQRSGKVAVEVKPEQWAGFNAKLRKAADCLEEAGKLHPEFPESSAKRITIAMADEEIAGGSPRHWADIALAAQLDYVPAYTAMRWALRPRWGGSTEEMLSFGLECAASKRFDTIVPWLCTDAIHDVVEEVGVEKTPLASDEVFQQVAQMLKGYASAQDEPDWYFTYLLGLMWDHGRYREAGELLASRPIKIEPSALTTAGSMPAEVAAGLEAMRGDTGIDVRAAESNFRRARYEDALDAYQVILRGLKADDPARPFVAARAVELGWLTRFLAGETVDIQPSKEMSGWYPGAGNWHVDDDGKLVGELSVDGLRCICGANFGTRYEFTATVEVVSSDPKRAPTIGAGLFFGWVNPATRYIVTVIPNRGAEFDNQHGDQPATVADRKSLGASNTLVVTVWENCCAASVNGKDWFPNLPLWFYCAGPDARIGLGSRVGGSGHTALFTGLKIRMLTERPKIVSRINDRVKPG